MRYLYYEDLHLTDFEARVVSCARDEKSGKYQVILDQTAFFPEQGGQSADRGSLNGIPVLDARIKDGVIRHILDAPVPEGVCVSCHVDWDRRFDFMQQHTGEHIISGLVHRHFQYDNVGFHLSDGEVTLDFNGELSLTQLREIEAEANENLWKALPVRISFPSPEELARKEYRSKKELSGEIRIVEIPGVDSCACCAPHVENTAQIGLIKITGVQSHRGGVRVNILCGGRAVRDYTVKQDSVAHISARLSARQEDVAEAVGRLTEELGAKKERINGLQRELLQMQMNSLPSPEETDSVTLFVAELDNIAIRNAVNELTAKYRGYCSIFAGDDLSGYRFITGSTAGNCLAAAERMRGELGAKCGGSAPMIQGSLKVPRAKIQEFFRRTAESGKA